MLTHTTSGNSVLMVYVQYSTSSHNLQIHHIWYNSILIMRELTMVGWFCHEVYTNTRLGILHVNTPFPHKVFCWGCLRHWREAFRLFCWSCLTISYSDTIGTPFVFVSVPCSDWSRCCAVIDCRVVMMPERAIRRIVERSHSLLIERCHFFFNCLDWCEAMHGAFWSFLVPFWVPESTKLRCCAAALLRRIDAVVASLLYHILFV